MFSLNRRLALLTCALLTACAPSTARKAVPAFSIGAVADCQYADRDDSGDRRYRSCPRKLRDAVEAFNRSDLAFVVHLGDLIDRDWRSFDVLTPITDELVHPLRHVVGNHDYDVADEFKPYVHERLDMPARYYSFDAKGWTFVVLDGTDVSTYGWPDGSAKHARNMALYDERYHNRATWNGAIGTEQLAWLDQILADADMTGRRVVLFSHFPVFPEDPHNLWNADEILVLLEKHVSTVAWFNGHNHAGAYGERNGVHFVTLNAMSDFDDNAYSIIHFYHDRLELVGHGRQHALSLPYSPLERRHTQHKE